MAGKSRFRLTAAGAIAAFAASFSIVPLACADTGSDGFNREVQSVSRQLQRGEIVLETAAAPSQQMAGVAGRAGEVMGGGEAVADTGSRWFNSYVEQLNRQLRVGGETTQ